MCGITGIYKANGRLTRDTLSRMTRTLRHRGPDAENCFVEHLSNGAVGLGHTRLSILDLSDAGAQPMCFEHLAISYNGEVYNFREIRKDLEALEYKFVSDSDTEVVLKAFHCWGVKAFDRFIGMFALAILDKRTNEIYLCRDRVGVKPLYYCHTGPDLFFASELRAFSALSDFKKDLNPKALYQFLQYGYISGSCSIFEHSHKLLPGHYAIFSPKTGELVTRQFWSVREQYDRTAELTREEAVEELGACLRDAFRYRLVADVPVGLFLSGGFDSGCLAALLQSSGADIKAYTMGFVEKEYDESKDAAAIARHLGIQHETFLCTLADAKSLIPQLAEIYDEPFGDASALPTVLLSRLIRREVKVALSADGGDELFGGYSRYPNILRYWQKSRRIAPLARAILPLMDVPWLAENGQAFGNTYVRARKFLGLAACTQLEFSYAEYLKRMADEFMERTVPYAERFGLVQGMAMPKDRDDMDKLTAFDTQTYLPDDVLVKVDRASMSQGLEAREPFLDHRLIQFAASLPATYKLTNGAGKQILRELVYRYIPKELMDRPKRGFGVPVMQWLRSDLRSLLTDILAPQTLRSAGIYNARVIELYLDRFLKGDAGDYEWLWFLFVFEMWRQRWAG